VNRKFFGLPAKSILLANFHAGYRDCPHVCRQPT
jgi:hypothetical protein